MDLKRSRPRRGVYVVAGWAASLVATAVAVAALVVAPGESTAASPSTPTASYAVFSSAQSAGGAMPPELAAQQSPDAQVSSQPTTVPGLAAWAVATNDQLCVVESDPGGQSEACAPANTLSAEANDLLFTATANGTASTDVDEVDLVVGLAPDGVHAVHFTFGDGTGATAPVVDNGFQLATSSLVTIASVSWTDATGVTHTQEVGNP